MEIWKQVVGYENLYEVSSIGRVKRVGGIEFFKSRRGNLVSRTRKGGIIVLKEAKGYLRAHLCMGGKAKPIMAHRLVAIAFTPNPNNYPEINHKNGIRSENRVENLEWCTKSQNIRHCYDVLKRPISPNVINVYGGNHPASTPIFQYDLSGNFIKEWSSAIEIQRELSIHSPNVIACCRGRQQTSGGFIWRHKLERKFRKKRKTQE